MNDETEHKKVTFEEVCELIGGVPSMDVLAILTNDGLTIPEVRQKLKEIGDRQREVSQEVSDVIGVLRQSISAAGALKDGDTGGAPYEVFLNGFLRLDVLAKDILTLVDARPPSDASIEAAAEIYWNDRDARMGGPWSEVAEGSVVKIQTLATSRAAVIAAFAARCMPR